VIDTMSFIYNYGAARIHSDLRERLNHYHSTYVPRFVITLDISRPCILKWDKQLLQLLSL